MQSSHLTLVLSKPRLKLYFRRKRETSTEIQVSNRVCRFCWLCVDFIRRFWRLCQLPPIYQIVDVLTSIIIIHDVCFFDLYVFFTTYPIYIDIRYFSLFLLVVFVISELVWWRFFVSVFIFRSRFIITRKDGVFRYLSIFSNIRIFQIRHFEKHIFGLFCPVSISLNFNLKSQYAILCSVLDKCATFLIL